MILGILALQGNYIQHKEVLENLHIKNLEIILIKSTIDLNYLLTHSNNAGLILPGGESTTISYLLEVQNMYNTLKTLIKDNLPVLATCAGAILLAKEIHVTVNTNTPHKIKSFACTDITISRNAYGRQIKSFMAKIQFKTSAIEHTQEKIEMINGLFIRAPIIKKHHKSVQVLAEYEQNPVIVKDHNRILCTFHPEALNENRLHKYFIDNILTPYCNI